MSTLNAQIFPSDRIFPLHTKIPTPALLILENRLVKNISDMQTLAETHSCKLRPHIKTHKSVDLALRQITAGASGITVAKLSEAEIMAEAGINDIFIANQITQHIKMSRLKELHRKIRLIIGLDHPDQISVLEKTFHNTDKPLEVRIEIDSGLHRCGMAVDETLVTLAEKVQKTDWLETEGIFTHAGQSYAAGSTEEIMEIGIHEGAIMEKAARMLSQNGIKLKTVSTGSTPTVRWSAANPSVNEIRPGNYVFYDGIQVALGVCGPEKCSLFVMSTVISQPSENQIVIDAGSKALNLDRGAHSSSLVSGYGTLINIDGEIVRLSEEHGVIRLRSPQPVKIGSPVIIIPNHACAVANLYEKYYLISHDKPITEIPVSARGNSQ
ncbi:MAG: alanine racemase [Calditrichaceae bacterium]